jgi:protein-disulfide isomerase
MSSLQVPVTDADHIEGDGHALVTLVEYGDYECPICGLAYPVVKRVQKHFGKRLRFVFRNFPLTQIHPEAENAAETAEFAGAHDQFWQMHDALFENQEALGPELYSSLADTLGLPAEGLKEALGHRTFRPKIRSDFMGGLKSGVNGTPTFFINGTRHDAGNDYEDLVGAIDTQLATEARRSGSAL